MTKIKICCISSLEEARLAIEHGAYAIGLVGRMPSGPGPIEDDLIAEIVDSIPPLMNSFLLTSETEADAIIAHHARVKTTAIQIVDAVTSGTYTALRMALPGIKLVQVIHVRNERAIDEALAAAEHVDHLLLDSGNPDLRVKELGGTGRTHDWSISRRIVEQSSVPVFLAGGLNGANVRQAIDRVQPYGVDVCSGVRTNGMLEQEKLSAFFRSVQDRTTSSS